MYQKIDKTLLGFDPGIFRSVVRRVICCATRPSDKDNSISGLKIFAVVSKSSKSILAYNGDF